MRKNGFTLIELLAVIVILAIIALIATPIILGIINDAREKANERSVELYASAVRNGIAAHQLRTGNEVLPGTYNETNKLPFEPDYEGNVECTNIIISEDGKVSLDKCTVNGGTKEYSYGMEEEPQVAKGTMAICDPVSVQTEGAYTAGDKYTCEVADGVTQTFYVLTTPASGATSVNLIMDSNITSTGEAIKDANPTDKGLVAWVSKTDYTSEEIGGTEADWDEVCDECGNWNKGSISAMNHLASATAGWTNANPQTISTFTDDAGETHNMAKTYTANARMPYYSEVGDSNGSNEYLYEYLDGSYWWGSGTQPTNNVSGVNGYWTLSSSASTSYSAWLVDGLGYVSYRDVFDDGNYGVRPVINLSI